MHEPVAILIPTFDRYLPLAELTCDLLDRFWAQHPGIYFCGVSKSSRAEMIPPTADPKDWIGIAHSASAELLRRGIRRIYLILDDHPPVALCNARYLNEQLPAVAEKLGAAYMGLGAWDQFRPWQGTDMGPEYLHVRKMPANFLWKFSLHPALWDVRAFHDILSWMVSLNPRPLSARDFESRTGAADANIKPEWLDASYRIAGNPFAVGRHFLQSPWKRAVYVPGFHAIRWATRLIRGTKGLDDFDCRTRFIQNYQNGPYPIFWSGLMSRGGQYLEAVKLMRYIGETDVAAAVESAFQKMSG